MSETAPRIVAVLRSNADLVHCMRSQVEQLDVSRVTIDEISGVSNGYASKLLASPPMKNLTLDSAAFFLPAIGLRLAVIEDPGSLARLRHRMIKRVPNRANVVLESPPWQRERELWLAMCSRGGKASAKKLSRAERSERAKRAAEARTESLTAWRRKQIARAAGIASGKARRERAALAKQSATSNQCAETAKIAA